MYGRGGRGAADVLSGLLCRCGTGLWAGGSGEDRIAALESGGEGVYAGGSRKEKSGARLAERVRAADEPGAGEGGEGRGGGGSCE